MTLRAAGTVALLAAAHQMLTGLSGVRGARVGPSTTPVAVADRNLDSELRFYAAWYAVAGILMHKAAVDSVIEGRVLGPISVGWGLAGTSRLLSTRAVGPPDPVFTALAALELALAVVLAPRRLRPPLRGDDLDNQRCGT